MCQRTRAVRRGSGAGPVQGAPRAVGACREVDTKMRRVEMFGPQVTVDSKLVAYRGLFMGVVFWTGAVWAPTAFEKAHHVQISGNTSIHGKKRLITATSLLLKLFTATRCPNISLAAVQTLRDEFGIKGGQTTYACSQFSGTQRAIQMLATTRPASPTLSASITRNKGKRACADARRSAGRGSPGYSG